MSGSEGLFEPAHRAKRPIDEHVRIGHVHLRTADIDCVRAFYVDILGFDVVLEARDVPGWGTTGDILFVSAGGCHHHLGFSTWLSADGEPQQRGRTGPHPGNDLELAWDRPFDEWPGYGEDGMQFFDAERDLNELLAVAF